MWQASSHILDETTKGLDRCNQFITAPLRPGRSRVAAHGSSLVVPEEGIAQDGREPRAWRKSPALHRPASIDDRGVWSISASPETVSNCPFEF